MHFIQSQTHNSTHVKAPYKYDENGVDIAAMPLEKYMGEAVVCDFDDKLGKALDADDMMACDSRRDDIVLMRTSEKDISRQPYLGWEAVDWLIETGIKAFGKDDSDSKMLLAGIPILDAVTGLEQITKPPVFFIGLPVKIRRVTASWARAIVLEER
jgi:arylformamidase